VGSLVVAALVAVDLSTDCLFMNMLINDRGSCSSGQTWGLVRLDPKFPSYLKVRSPIVVAWLQKAKLNGGKAKGCFYCLSVTVGGRPATLAVFIPPTAASCCVERSHDLCRDLASAEPLTTPMHNCTFKRPGSRYAAPAPACGSVLELPISTSKSNVLNVDRGCKGILQKLSRLQGAQYIIVVQLI
jgi:hypothetical protein